MSLFMKGKARYNFSIFYYCTLWSPIVRIVQVEISATPSIFRIGLRLTLMSDDRYTTLGGKPPCTPPMWNF